VCWEGACSCCCSQPPSKQPTPCGFHTARFPRVHVVLSLLDSTSPMSCVYCAWSFVRVLNCTVVITGECPEGLSPTIPFCLVHLQ